MKISERKQFRDNLLRNLYEIYFTSNGSGKKISLDELNNDTELSLAYQYLIDKGFVRRKHISSLVFAHIITFRGIDYIESTFGDTEGE